MNDSYRKLLSLVPESDPPQKTYDRVVAAVARLEIRRAQMRASVYGIFVIGAIIAFVPALRYMITAANDSGFWQYLSLLTSDGGVIASHFSEFIGSIADSAPIAGIASLVGIVTVFIYSVGRVALYVPALIERPTSEDRLATA